MSEPTVSLDFAGRSSPSQLLDVLQRSDPASPVTVLVPSWFSVADRHHVATYLDPEGEREMVFVSSTLAGVYGHRLGTADEESMHAVLCFDLRRGWSAGLVRVEPGVLTEVACWGIPTEDVTGPQDGAATSRTFVDRVMAAASTVPGIPAISAVLVMDDDGVTANLVRQALPKGDETATGSAVVVEACAAIGARGAQRQSAVTTTRLAPSVRSQPRSPCSPTAMPSTPAIRVVAPEHAIFPSSTRLAFDLGPDDGLPLHFDVYEQERAVAGADPVKGRAVLRAHLARERGYDRSMVVTFELKANGLFEIGPAKAWRLEWAPPSVDLTDSNDDA